MNGMIRHSRKAFTLMEMMIVVAIVGILMWIGIFPYAEYMRQATLSNNVDKIAQEWILAHKEVRNGLEKEKKHQSIIFSFKKGETEIKKYTFSGTWSNISSNLNPETPDKIISLDNNIAIQKLGGDEKDEELYYLIEAPNGEGKWWKELKLNSFNGTGSKTIKINYPGRNNSRGNILLRPYLQ